MITIEFFFFGEKHKKNHPERIINSNTCFSLFHIGKLNGAILSKKSLKILENNFTGYHFSLIRAQLT